jgi:hypothetical protein
VSLMATTSEKVLQSSDTNAGAGYLQPYGSKLPPSVAYGIFDRCGE